MSISACSRACRLEEKTKGKDRKQAMSARALADLADMAGNESGCGISGNACTIRTFPKQQSDRNAMDIPLELSFHNMDPSDALKAAVESAYRQAGTVSRSHHRLPRGDRDAAQEPSHRPEYSRRACGAARAGQGAGGEPGDGARGGPQESRDQMPMPCWTTPSAAMQQLKDYRRIRQGDVKSKSGAPRGARGESGIS